VLRTYEHSLLPGGVAPRTAEVHVERTFQGDIRSAGTSTRTLYDADDIRGNADSPGEEVGPTGTEGVAVLRLDDGRTVEARVVRSFFTFYGTTTVTYAVETAALGAVGATVADIDRSISFTAADHDLAWTELGFQAAQ
jgi:hypothetical protein